MIAPDTERCVRLGELLAKGAEHVDPVGPARWKLTLDGGVEAHAHRCGEWLCLETTLEPGIEESWWQLLRRGSGLPGMAKISVDDDRTSRVQAELPLGRDVEIGASVAECCAGLLAAARPDGEPARTPEPQTEPARVSELERLCSEDGWTVRRRDDGRLAVSLERSGGEPAEATIDPQRGATRVSAPLGRLEETRGETDEDVREAAAHLLLSASRRLRLARPSVVCDGPRADLSFEVDLPVLAGRGWLHHGLAALWVGWSSHAAEISLLREQAIGGLYRRARGLARSSNRRISSGRERPGRRVSKWEPRQR